MRLNGLHVSDTERSRSRLSQCPVYGIESTVCPSTYSVQYYSVPIGGPLYGCAIHHQSAVFSQRDRPRRYMYIQIPIYSLSLCIFYICRSINLPCHHRQLQITRAHQSKRKKDNKPAMQSDADVFLYFYYPFVSTPFRLFYRPVLELFFGQQMRYARSPDTFL